MTDIPVFFAEALPKVARIMVQSGVPEDKILLIRDFFGRLRIAIDAEADGYLDAKEQLEHVLDEIGVYAAPGESRILFRRDFVDPDVIFSDAEIQSMWLPEFDSPIRILDRQIVGQDWLAPQPPGATPRLVFYGFKGGVGRTTALSILAYHLANNGKRVLLFDLDLESPGLSSLLVPPESRADFGLVDWFVEDAVGQGELVLHRMVTASPLGQQTTGAIRVVAAWGQETGESNYLAKLSRVYADINRDGNLERFAARVRTLVQELEAQEQPDVVLIDSRAGLHDLAAISIMALSTFAYLFMTDSVQSWQGYRLLFAHWRAYPEILRQVRDRLVTVQAMFPELGQEASADRFLEESYTLFSETLYESIAPGLSPQSETFNFDLKDESAPHYPVRIRWHNSLQEFDPLLRSRQILDDPLMDATFGSFIKRVESDLEGEQ